MFVTLCRAVALARLAGDVVLGAAGECPKRDLCAIAHLLVLVAWLEMARSGGAARAKSKSIF